MSYSLSAAESDNKWASVGGTSPTNNGVYIVRFEESPFTGVCLWDLEDWWLLDRWLNPGFTVEMTHWSSLPTHWQQQTTLVSSAFALSSSKPHNTRLVRSASGGAGNSSAQFVATIWHREGEHLPLNDGVYLHTLWDNVYPVLWCEGEWSTLDSFQECSKSNPGGYWADLPSTLDEYQAILAAAEYLERSPVPENIWELI